MSAETKEGDLLDALADLYEALDRDKSGLEHQHAAQLQCKKGCSGCCVDDLSVFAIEAEHIRKHRRQFLKEAAPGKLGQCAFLDSVGQCRIYEHRPYVCRTQGLPLRWLEEDAAVEYRDICPLNLEGIPLEELEEDQCWTLGPYEGRLAELERRRSKGPLERIPLRQLFKKS